MKKVIANTYHLTYIISPILKKYSANRGVEREWNEIQYKLRLGFEEGSKMGYTEDFKIFAEKQFKCKTCISYDSKNNKLNIDEEYRGKVAICMEKHSGRYIVGHNSLCCEFYKKK